MHLLGKDVFTKFKFHDLKSEIAVYAIPELETDLALLFPDAEEEEKKYLSPQTDKQPFFFYIEDEFNG